MRQLAYVGSEPVTSMRMAGGSTRMRAAGVHELVHARVEACVLPQFHYKLLQAKNLAARSPALEPDQHAWMEVTGDQQLAIEAVVTLLVFWCCTQYINAGGSTIASRCPIAPMCFRRRLLHQQTR
jgi:hypothetical protein